MTTDVRVTCGRCNHSEFLRAPVDSSDWLCPCCAWAADKIERLSADLAKHHEPLRRAREAGGVIDNCPVCAAALGEER